MMVSDTNVLNEEGPVKGRREIVNAGTEVTESGCLPISEWFKPTNKPGKKYKTKLPRFVWMRGPSSDPDYFQSSR